MEGSDLLHTFERELLHSTEQMQALLLEVEQMGGFDDAAPMLQECYRLAHSLKGASRVVGLFPIEEMAHALEDRLQVILQESNLPSATKISAYLGIVDGFNAAFHAFLNGEMFDSASRLENLAASDSSLSAASPDLSKSSVEDLFDQPQTAQSAQKEDRLYKREEQVSVPSRQIDELFRRVEEAFLLESRIRSLIAEADTLLQEQLPPHLAPLWLKIAGPLKNEMSRLHFVLMQFHDAVHQFRMVPMNRLRVAAQKAVRDLAETLQKPVAFRFQGMHQMVDASLLEALMESVLHLVRNAVDHGIEFAPERQAQGKPVEGRITVHTEVTAGFLTVTLTDDGRGIPMDKIRNRALEMRLVSSDEAQSLTDQDWLEFMFRPGFSTAYTISAISGRGIGMDIARRRIQDLGGHLQVSTRSGVGTTFSIQVPIGLLTPRVLVVRTGEYLAAIPASEIERVFRYDPALAQEVNGTTVITWDRTPVQLDLLAGHLGWHSANTGSGHVVLLNRQGLRKAMLVDEVISEIEQVAFPPPWNMRGLPYLSGVIVMGSGTLVPVIESGDLLRKATQTTFASTEQPATAAQPRSILVVDDSPTILALHRSVLKNAGYHVLTAENGNSAWSSLQIQEVDLLLTDIEMPGMNGLDLIRKIRESTARRHLPIIVISQYGSREDLQRGANAGADRYIVKSAFNPQKLLEMVQELLMEG